MLIQIDANIRGNAEQQLEQAAQQNFVSLQTVVGNLLMLISLNIFLSFHKHSQKKMPALEYDRLLV